MRLCNGGELFHELQKQSTFTEKDACLVFKQVTSAIIYLHSFDLCHGDLKPENVLLMNTGDLSSLKLIDFGYSTKIEYGQFLKLPFGTAIYFAPELILQNFDIRIDNWCLGIILYMMICGRFPFSGQNKKQILMAIMNGVFTFSHEPFKNASAEVKDLISKLLTRNPNDRYEACEAIIHPWVRRMHSENIDNQFTLDSVKKLGDFSKKSTFKKWINYMLSLRISEKNVSELRKVYTTINRSSCHSIKMPMDL